MTYTIPADNHLVGDTGHTGIHNNMADILTKGLVSNVLNTTFSGGADPTGTSDSSAAINAAITAMSAFGGGTVRIPGLQSGGAQYKLTSPIQHASNVRLVGDGPGAVTLKPTGSNNAINVTSASAMTDVTIQGMTIQGPGSGTGIGILASANSGALRVERLKLANVIVTGMGSHGGEIDNSIMSDVSQCKFISNGARGLYFNGGTTWKVSNSWFTGNASERGFYAFQSISSTLIACGSDSNAIGYELNSCTAIQMLGCDVSGTVAAGGLDGTSIKINGCFGVTVDGSFVANNAAVGVWVTAASGGVRLFGIIETASGSPTASIKTDSGTDVLIDGPDLVTATSYAANTISLLAGSYCFFSDIEAGIAQVDNGLTLLGGTTSTPPLKLTSGTNLTSAAAGAVEYDGVAPYFTGDTTSGRGLVPVEQRFRLTATGGTISTIANYFGTNSNISLVSGGEYEIEIDCWFLKTTSGTVTWTFTNSAAPTSMTIDYQLSPATGIVTTAAATDLFGQQYNVTATAPTVVSASLTTAVNHRHRFRIRLINGTGTSLKIQATAGAGTITPGINSYWKARRVPLANVGSFAA